MLTGAPKQQPQIALNLSVVPPNPDRDPDLLLPHCWRLQDCTGCLEARYHCSWCPVVRGRRFALNEYSMLTTVVIHLCTESCDLASPHPYFQS